MLVVKLHCHLTLPGYEWKLLYPLPQQRFPVFGETIQAPRFCPNCALTYFYPERIAVGPLRFQFWDGNKCVH